MDCAVTARPQARDDNMDVLKFKQRLLDKERELISEIARLEGEAGAGGEGEVRDPTDAATASQEADESLQEGALASETLVEVQDALRRIEAGTYGKCTQCGREIEPARLEAVPWARYCLKDQEKYDRAAHVPQGGSTL
jgi:DnaK suppressor protein